MKYRVAVILAGLISIFSLGGNALAQGGGCPAFTSAMVDAAWLAINYSQSEPPVGVAVDVPSKGIYCQLRNDVQNLFWVEVGREDGVALVVGFGENEPFAPALLRTRVDGLTRAEEHACRAQIRSSFAWNRYCKPVLIDDF